MLFQKKDISSKLSPWIGLGSRSKADLDEKICEIFGVYQLLVTTRKNDKLIILSERVNKNLEKFSLTFRSYVFSILYFFL